MTHFRTDATPSSDTAKTSETSDASTSIGQTPNDNVRELPLPVPIPTLTNSPSCVPSRPGTPRRMRSVHVDAWSVPASTNWSRTRGKILKVNRVSRSADWALPF